MDVLRRYVREIKRPQRVIYGVLVTNNFKTYKAYASPYYTMDVVNVVSDYVSKFDKEKLYTRTTQTTRTTFRRSNNLKPTRQNFTTTHGTKQDKTTQSKDNDKLAKCNKVVKVNKPYKYKEMEKLQQYVYYYAQVLAKSKTKQPRKELKPIT